MLCYWLLPTERKTGSQSINLDSVHTCVNYCWLTEDVVLWVLVLALKMLTRLCYWYIIPNVQKSNIPMEMQMFYSWPLMALIKQLSYLILLTVHSSWDINWLNGYECDIRWHQHLVRNRDINKLHSVFLQSLSML